MCGILGIANKNGLLPDKAIYESMLKLLAHRGPDVQGSVTFNKAILGSRRLSILDSKYSNQPIYNENKKIALVFNGEIYNYLELRSRLATRGHNFYSNGDGEVLVHLYEEHGVNFVKHLKGMFAFALWDDNLEMFVIGRDHVGKKPVVYTTVDDTFIVASEINSLLAFPGIDVTVDEKAILSFFYLGYIPNPSSGIEKVKKLQPGSILVWKNNHLTVTRFWHPTTNIIESPLNGCIEKIDSLLGHSVSTRIPQEVPFGIFLSGGMDSSLVVGFAKKVSPVPIKTFSISFGNKNYDEAYYSRCVAQHFGTEHHELKIQQPHTDDVIKILHMFGEPFADSSIIPSYLLAVFAKELVPVVLTGDGGDELLGGYYRYVEALKSEDCLGVNIEIKMGDYKDLNKLLPELDGPEEIAEFLLSKYEDSNSLDKLGKLLLLDFETYLLDDILFKADITTMAASLEARSPYLDIDFVRWCFSLPSSLKINSGISKFVLRKAALQYLPSMIVDRPKQGFSPPLIDWMNGSLKELINDTLITRNGTSGLYDIGYVQKQLSQNVNKGNYALIWKLLVFELWYQSIFH